MVLETNEGSSPNFHRSFFAVCTVNDRMMMMCTALKIHMSENAYNAVKEFPQFITEPRGETFVKVSIISSSPFSLHFPSRNTCFIYVISQLIRVIL